MKHARDYLRETTVHGFRYVLEGRTRPERLFWVAAIATAFGYVAYFGSRSIIEARDNPIASVVDIANTDSLVFPAVTLLGDDGFQSTSAGGTRELRFLASVLNTIELDCYHSSDADCLDRTQKVRSDFKPLIANFAEALLQLWRSDDMRGKRALPNTELFDYKNGFTYSESILTEVGARFCTFKLAGDVTAVKLQELDERFATFLADTMRYPEEKLLAALDDFIMEANGSLVMGSTSYIGTWEPLCSWESMEEGGTSTWMNVMVAVYAPEFLAKNELLLGDLINWSYFSMKYFDLHDFVAKRPGHVAPNVPGYDSTTYPDEVMSVLNQSDFTAGELLKHFSDFQLKSIVDYPKKKLGLDLEDRCDMDTLSPYDENSKACKKLVADFQSNLDSVLKVMKWANRPAFASIAGDMELKEMAEALSLETYPRRCNLTGHGCHSVDPWIVNCQFDHKEPTDVISERQRGVHDCGFFKRSLGPEGIGYTFNGIAFWDMYQRTNYLQDFYKEIHSQDIFDEFQAGNYSYSARKTLDFTIHPSMEHAFLLGVPRRSPPIYRLSFHEPSKFPLNQIKIEPGFR